MTQHEVSAEPLAWALERLSFRAAVQANDDVSARVACAFAQLSQQVRQAPSLQDAITCTIAALPVGSNDATGLNALIDAEIRAGVRARFADPPVAPCIWEGCDQLAKYCENHAAELVDPLGQLEELRACVGVVRELWEELAEELAAHFTRYHSTALTADDSMGELREVMFQTERTWQTRGLELGRKLGAAVAPDKPTNTGG